MAASFLRDWETKPVKTDEQLLEELRTATKGLLFMSEADYPLEVIRLDDRLAPGPQRLLELSGAAAGARVETVELEEFFRSALSEPQWKRGEELNNARRYQSLVRLLRENLEELSVHRVGKINMTVFILGKSSQGNWLGLRTRVVET